MVPDGTNIPDGVVLRQFRPGATLMASVTDPDAVTNADDLLMLLHYVEVVPVVDRDNRRDSR